MDKAILRQWLKAGYMEEGFRHPTDEGSPQGGIISPVAANMTLNGLEQKLRQTYPRNTRKGQWAQVHMVRFADDLIITGCTRKLLEEEVQPLVETFLRERGLELSPEKTTLTHIEEGVDFLGQNLRKYNGKYLTKPAKKNVQAFLTKVRKVIKENPTATAGNLIKELNPKITVVSLNGLDELGHQLKWC